MECRLCSFQRTTSITGPIKRDMTREETTAALAERILEAEDHFFRGHWGETHPVEAEAIMHHIRVVEKLARVSSFHKRVLDGRIEVA